MEQEHLVVLKIQFMIKVLKINGRNIGIMNIKES